MIRVGLVALGGAIGSVARYGVGVDMIDIDAATDMGIAVANVPPY